MLTQADVRSVPKGKMARSPPFDPKSAGLSNTSSSRLPDG
jgi:hypothetical protein